MLVRLAVATGGRRGMVGRVKRGQTKAGMVERGCGTGKEGGREKSFQQVHSMRGGALQH